MKVAKDGPVGFLTFELVPEEDLVGVAQLDAIGLVAVLYSPLRINRKAAVRAARLATRITLAWELSAGFPFSASPYPCQSSIRFGKAPLDFSA